MGRKPKNGKTVRNNRLRELREDVYSLGKGKLSQEKLASELYEDCSAQSVYEWENGRSEPSPKAVSAYQKFFGCTYDFLTGTSDDPRLTQKEWVRKKNRAHTEEEIANDKAHTRDAFIRFLTEIGYCTPAAKPFEDSLYEITGSIIKPSEMDIDFGYAEVQDSGAIVSKDELDIIISHIIHYIDQCLGTFAEFKKSSADVITPTVYKGK